jgi:hypothetical protein
MKEKVDLSNAIIDNNLFPSDWVYENIWHMSEDQYDEYRDLIREDSKRKFRITQIESEGNDPQVTGQSYGTPHDLATLYGRGRYDGGEVPEGYDEKSTLGRPEEKSTKINTQDNTFGKDRIGALGMKKDTDSSDSIKPQYKGGSPLALENKKISIFQKEMLAKIPQKKLIFESDNEKSSLLDEKQIRE